MGSTGIGAVGGQNSYKLIGTDIPQVSTSYTPAGTTNIGHSHSLGTTNVALASGNAAGVGDHQHLSGVYNNAAAGGQGGYNVITTAGSQPVSGLAGAHGHSVSGTTNIDHSHTLGTTNVGLSGTPATITVGNAVGSQTSVENRPLYFAAVYVMRVK
jgi:hypothetical protein